MNSWVFFGEVCASEPDWASAATTVPLPTVAGWVRAGGELSAEGWTLVIEGTTSDGPPQHAELFCKNNDAELLRNAASVQLSVFASGRLLLAGENRLVVLERMQLWFRDQTTPLTSLIVNLGLKTLAQRVFDTSRQDAIQTLWSPSTIGINLREPYSSCHPSVQRCLPFIANLRSDLVPIITFLAHKEALDVTGSGSIWAPAVTRLGSSAVSFVHTTSRLVASSSSLQTEGQMLRAPAIVLYGSDSRRLIDSTIAYVQLPALRHKAPPGLTSDSGLEGGTLIVAPRCAITNAISSLIGIADVLATTIKEFRNQRRNISALNIAVMSLELITSHDPTRNVHWDRCVIIGWPQTSDALDRAKARPRAQFTVGVAHDAELDAGLVQCTTKTAIQKIASLIEAPEWSLDAPDTLLQVLQSRFFCVSPDLSSGGPLSDTIIPYDVHCGPPPDDDEELFRRGARGVYRDRSFVFPAFASLRGPFRRVRGREEEVRDHFRQSGALVTSCFANRSIDQLRSDDGTAHKECPICYECRAETVTACGHWFCAGCLRISLDREPVCPMCRTPTDARRDAVSVGRAPSMSESQEACLPFLATTIKSALPARTLVIASFPELHDRVCKSLVSLGVPIRVWGGSATQIIQNEEAFKIGTTVRSLLIDPCTMPCHWTIFNDVDQILVLLPLCTRRRAACCQIKEVVDACEGSQPKVMFLVRDESNLPSMNPLCKGISRVSGRLYAGRLRRRCAHLVRT